MSDTNAMAAPSGGGRLQSLDACRGLIMFTLMCGPIFQSLRGEPVWHWLAVQNDHVAWEGCVYWDLIQPSFIYMVGAAMPFAFAARAARGDSRASRIAHAVKRAACLILSGLMLDQFGAREWQFGLIRVLQQIALAYLGSFWLVGRGYRAQAFTAAAILMAHTLVWLHNPWNGPAGPWARGNENLGSVFDRWLLGRNYQWFYVTTNFIPSTATMLFGMMAGESIRRDVNRRRVSPILLAAGVGAVAAGWALAGWIPMIKRLWTASFTLFAGGCTTLMLLAFYWAIDVRGWKRWSFPLVVVGMNSIAAYVMENTMRGWFRSLSQAWVGWLEAPLGSRWFPVFQNGLFALAAWTVLHWLWRKRIFIKV